MHRPLMDWAAAERRHQPGSPEQRVFDALRELAAARRSLLALRAGGDTRALWTDTPAVLAYTRRHPRSGHFLALANFAEHEVWVEGTVLGELGGNAAEAVLATGPDGSPARRPLELREGRVVLPALGFCWLTER